MSFNNRMPFRTGRSTQHGLNKQFCLPAQGLERGASGGQGRDNKRGEHEAKEKFKMSVCSEVTPCCPCCKHENSAHSLQTGEDRSVYMRSCLHNRQKHERFDSNQQALRIKEMCRSIFKKNKTKGHPWIIKMTSGVCLVCVSVILVI